MSRFNLHSKVLAMLWTSGKNVKSHKQYVKPFSKPMAKLVIATANLLGFCVKMVGMTYQIHVVRRMTNPVDAIMNLKRKFAVVRKVST